MPPIKSDARRRAINAALAVTLGGTAALVACGATGIDHPEPGDTSSDTATLPGEICSGERDDVCPDFCDWNNDFDCCELVQEPYGEWCTWDPGYGCGCSVAGPFAPPSHPSRQMA